MEQSIVQYKEFIDALAELRKSIVAHQVKMGIWNSQKSPDDKPLNQLLHSLSRAQRELLAEAIQNAVDGAIEDLLSYMGENDYQLSRLGIELAEKPFDAPAHFDFRLRVEGRPWPDDRTTMPTPSTAPSLNATTGELLKARVIPWSK